MKFSYVVASFFVLSSACQPLVFENSGDTPKPDDDVSSEPDDSSSEVTDVPSPTAGTGVQEGNLEKVGNKLKVDISGKVVVKNSSHTATPKKVSAKVSLKVKVNSRINPSTGSVSTPGATDPSTTDPGAGEPDEGGVGDSVSDEVDRIEAVTKVRASVKFIQETAGFLNTFGWYKVDKDKNIHDVQMIWKNASAVNSQYGQGPLQAGETLDLGLIEEDVQLGFFIVANGFAENNWEDVNQDKYIDLQNGSLEFRDGDSYQQSSPAKLSSVSPVLWFVPNQGAPFALESRTNEQIDYGLNAIYHTAAARENSLQLNPDGVDHIRHRILEPEKRFSIEIEDLYYSENASTQEFDGDYKDLVFELTLSSSQTSQPTVKTFE